MNKRAYSVQPCNAGPAVNGNPVEGPTKNDGATGDPYGVLASPPCWAYRGPVDVTRTNPLIPTNDLLSDRRTVMVLGCALSRGLLMMEVSPSKRLFLQTPSRSKRLRPVVTLPTCLLVGLLNVVHRLLI